MGAGTKFRQILAKNGLVEAMAAHSPLSAMLVAEAGFDAIWASGFELSAMYGVPDVSVVSMTQHLDMTRAMAERSGLPVVADIDTGFGSQHRRHWTVRRHRLDQALLGQDLTEFRARAHDHPFSRASPSSARNRAPASISRRTPSCRAVTIGSVPQRST